MIIEFIEHKITSNFKVPLTLTASIIVDGRPKHAYWTRNTIPSILTHITIHKVDEVTINITLNPRKISLALKHTDVNGLKTSDRDYNIQDPRFGQDQLDEIVDLIHKYLPEICNEPIR